MPSLVDIGQLFWRKKIFEKFCQCIFAILLLSLLGKRCGTSFELTLSSSQIDALCQVWLKLAQWLILDRKQQ